MKKRKRRGLQGTPYHVERKLEESGFSADNNIEIPTGPPVENVEQYVEDDQGEE